MYRHGRTFWTWVRLQGGRRVRRSCGTGDRTTARQVVQMLDTLHARREWALLDAATAGPSSIGELFDYWQRNALDELRARLGDMDLAPLIPAWTRWAEGRANPATVAKYARQLRTLIPEGVPFLRSQFTRRYVAETSGKVQCSGPTLRRYLAAWSSFGRFLIERELMESNPVSLVRRPSAGRPRDIWLELADVVRLVDAQPEPFRALAALREGAGVEISAALAVRVRDVDPRSSRVYVRGTKTAARTRTVAVEPWAMKRLADYLRTVPATPEAPLFGGSQGVTARRALDVQRRELRRLGLDERYRLHDARHSYAVRMMKAGVNPEMIANNLGHADAVMVLRVYGKYRPAAADLARMQLRAVP